MRFTRILFRSNTGNAIAGESREQGPVLALVRRYSLWLTTLPLPGEREVNGIRIFGPDDKAPAARLGAAGALVAAR